MFNIFFLFQCVAFPDIASQAPTHILIVPKKPVAQLSKAEEEDEAVSIMTYIFQHVEILPVTTRWRHLFVLRSPAFIYSLSTSCWAT